MREAFIFAALLAFAAAATAQYKWVDPNGRVQYGDTPPAGVSATPLRPPLPGSTPAPADAKAAPKGPLTPAEQEAAFRKRQIDAAREREKQAHAEQQAAVKKENCERAQQNLRTLESGQRIARTDATGERYYLEDAQIAQEAASARQEVARWCG